MRRKRRGPLKAARQCACIERIALAMMRECAAQVKSPQLATGRFAMFGDQLA